MPTKALTVISCNPYSRAFPVDFSIVNHILTIGDTIITKIEFQGNIAIVNGYKSDGSKYTFNLHLHSTDLHALKKFVQ